MSREYCSAVSSVCGLSVYLTSQITVCGLECMNNLRGLIPESGQLAV